MTLLSRSCAVVLGVLGVFVAAGAGAGGGNCKVGTLAANRCVGEIGEEDLIPAGLIGLVGLKLARTLVWGVETVDSPG